MQLRVDQLVPYGYTDSTISTFHAFGDRLIREFALELGLPSDVRVLSRAGDGDLPARAPVRLRARRVPAARRSDRFLGALATHFSRLKDEDVDPADYLARGRARGRPRRAVRSSVAGSVADGDRRGRRGGVARWRRRQLELARAYRALPAAPARVGVHRLRRPGQPRAAAPARSRRPPGSEIQAPLPVHPRRRVPGHEPRPGGARRAARRAARQRDRRRRRRPVDLPLPRRRDQQHHGVPRAVRGACGGRPAPQLPLAGADPRGEPPAHPLQRSGPARGPGRDQQGAAGGPPEPPPGRRRPAVRHEAFATGSEEADWIAREIAGRIARGARPATTRCSSARTPPRTRSCAASTSPGSRGGSRGRSGLYARPEVRLLLAFLRAVADLSLERRRLCPGRVGGVRPRRRGPDRDRERCAAPEPVASGRSSRSSIASPACSGSRRRRGRAVARLRRRPAALRAARPRAAGGRGPVRVPQGLRAARAARRRPTVRPPRRRSRTSPGSSTSSGRSRRCWPTTAPSFVARHLQTLIEAGDDPPSAELDPDADAVAVLTVHKAKGLEFPVVFLSGLVAGRFPAAGRRDPLAIPAALLAGPRGRRRRPPPGGATAVLRRDDPGARRAAS